MHKPFTVNKYTQSDSSKPRVKLTTCRRTSMATRCALLALATLAVPPALSETRLSMIFPADTSPDDPASVKHYAPASNSALDTMLGNSWRHSFDLLLTVDGSSFTIFGAHGERFKFTPLPGHENGLVWNYSSKEKHSGELSRTDDHHRWTRTDGSIVVFTGSLPTTIIHPGAFSQQLNYHNGRLLSVDAHSEHSRPRRQYDFAYESGELTHIRFEGQRWYEYTFESTGQLALRPTSNQPAAGSARAERTLSLYQDALTECIAEEPVDSSCDTESFPAPRQFAEPSSIPGAIRIDVRPATCNSYFTDFYGITRGTQIENGLEQHSRYSSMTDTVRSFPIVDFFGDGEIRVVRSRDLSSPTLSSEQGEPLFDRLMRDGREIQQKFVDPLVDQGTLSVEENGRTTSISRQEVDRIILEVIVRYDLATPSQIAQIEKAREELLDEYGVELQVIEIP